MVTERMIDTGGGVRRFGVMKISSTMKAALVAIISAMPLIGNRSLAVLPCGTRTAQALEDRKLIRATAVPTDERVRWSLTDTGMELANGLWLTAMGCECHTPSIAHDATCPLAPPKTSTDGARVTAETHGECGLPLADHCPTCDECPRVPGPCYCSTVGTDGGLVTIQAPTPVPGYVIDFSDLPSTPLYRVAGHGDRDYHLVASDSASATVRPACGGMEWTYDRADVYRAGGGPLVSGDDVAGLPTPREAVAAVVSTPPWSAKGRKCKINRGARRHRKGN